MEKLEFHNVEDNVTGVVVESKHFVGGFAVVLRDDDSGNSFSARHFPADQFENAVAFAKKIANV